MKSTIRRSMLIGLGILALLTVSGPASAQRRPPLDRPRLGKNTRVFVPQFPRRNQRFPGPRAGAPNDRMLGANAERKRQNQMILRQLGLTGDQQTRMNEIWRSHEDQAVATGRRIRQARQALDRAIMNEQYDEPLIRQRIDDMASAVAERARLQALIRAQLRSVLSVDQIRQLKELQRQQRLEQREMQRQQQEEPAPSRPPDEMDGFDLMSLLLLDTR